MKKAVKNMLFAFILNISFSIIELFGGIFTNSISIISDALHDLGDAVSIAVSLFCEVRSTKSADSEYTYGYARYSVIGALITALVLLIGSTYMIYNSVVRIIYPTPVNYDGMIVLAVFGTVINGISALKMAKGKGINERTLSLHMLEDLLGWLAVLVGSVVIKFTAWHRIDAVMSLCISAYIIIHALHHLKEVFEILLQKAPEGINVDEVRQELEKIENVEEIEELRLWTLDGLQHYGTIKVKMKSADNAGKVKEKIRQTLGQVSIENIVIETE